MQFRFFSDSATNPSLLPPPNHNELLRLHLVDDNHPTRYFCRRIESLALIGMET